MKRDQKQLDKHVSYAQILTMDDDLKRRALAAYYRYHGDEGQVRAEVIEHRGRRYVAIIGGNVIYRVRGDGLLTRLPKIPRQMVGVVPTK